MNRKHLEKFICLTNKKKVYLDLFYEKYLFKCLEQFIKICYVIICPQYVFSLLL